MTKPMILVVEDEAKIAGLLRDYLEQSGFRTHWLARGDGVVDWHEQNSPDLILLDLMLPGEDGLNVCQALRARSQVPIIMVTARVDELDRLLGLEIGADDYICKPFSPREVVARVKAVLRRLQRNGEADESAHGLVIDKERLRIASGVKSVDLTRVECRLLDALLSYPGRVYSRNQLMERVYDDGRVVSDRTMDTHVKNLRRKLDQLDPNREFIHSVYGVGYRFE